MNQKLNDYSQEQREINHPDIDLLFITKNIETTCEIPSYEELIELGWNENTKVMIVSRMIAPDLYQEDLHRYAKEQPSETQI